MIRMSARKKPLSGKFSRARRRPPFNRTIYYCPKCSRPMYSNNSRPSVTYYYCTDDQCDGSKKVPHSEP